MCTHHHYVFVCFTTMIQNILYGDTLQQQVDCNKSRWRGDCGELSHLSVVLFWVKERKGFIIEHACGVLCAFVKQRVRQCNWLLAFCTRKELMWQSQRFLYTSPVIDMDIVSPFFFFAAQAVPFLPFEHSFIVYLCRQRFYFVNYSQVNSQ